jgi:hypothetical protein
MARGPIVAALLFGLKMASLVIVLRAVHEVGSRAANSLVGARLHRPLFDGAVPTDSADRGIMASIGA